MTRTVLPAKTEPSPARHLSLAARSEWIKLRTVRTSLYVLGSALLLSVALSALVSSTNTARTGPGFDPANITMSGLFVGQYLLASFGALAITSEFGTGLIRASLTATPRRLVLLAGKAAAVTGAALLAGLVIVACCLAISETVFFHRAPHAQLTDGPVIRVLTESVLTLVISAVLGLGLGALIRNSAGALVAAAVVFFLALPVVSHLPAGIIRTTLAWLLPFISTAWATRTGPMSHYAVVHQAPGPLSGLAAFAGEALLALIAGAIVLARRDA
ncbi:MAG TPA: hypothetical protein VF843_04265 [Streptosporangiaceae bacterium]